MKIIIIVFIAFIAVITVLGLMLESIAMAPNRRVQRERERQRELKNEAMARRREEEQKKAQQLKVEVEELRPKWKTHPLYHVILDACIAEVDKLCRLVAAHVAPNRRGTLNGEYCYFVSFTISYAGISGDVWMSFEKLGYSKLSSQQYCALALALGDGLREAFKSNPDIRIRASYYQEEDELKSGVTVGVVAHLKPIDL